MPKIDDSLKAEVVKWSAFYEHRIRMGSVCHLDSFSLPGASNEKTESHIPPRSICRQVYADLGKLSYGHGFRRLVWQSRPVVMACSARRSGHHSWLK